MKVSIDSRLVKPGDYFVPIVGETFDGHKFIKDAEKSGARGIIEEAELYEIASKKLSKINPTVIAITGSVGKTTMRDFVSTLLSAKYKVCKGMLNTKLGLAVDIVNDMRNNDNFFVAECGMDRTGELSETGAFIRPHAAVITDISESHMEKLGSLSAIKKAKSEIVYTLRSKGVVFLNWDSANVRGIVEYISQGVRHVKYGFSVSHKLDWGDNRLLGWHNQVNLLGAYSVASHFNIPEEALNTAIKRIVLPKGRMNKIKGINGSVLFDDTYNSSPVSASAALSEVATFFKYKDMTGRKIAILGGMLELGDYEDKGHKAVGDIVAKQGFNVLVLVGELARKIGMSSKLSNSDVEIYYCKDNVVAGKFVRETLKLNRGDVVLIKASQGIRLEKTVELIMAEPKRAKDLLVRQDARWI